MASLVVDHLMFEGLGGGPPYNGSPDGDIGSPGGGPNSQPGPRGP